jgi:hypothetical protein
MGGHDVVAEHAQEIRRLAFTEDAAAHDGNGFGSGWFCRCRGSR